VTTENSNEAETPEAGENTESNEAESSEAREITENDEAEQAQVEVPLSGGPVSFTTTSGEMKEVSAASLYVEAGQVSLKPDLPLEEIDKISLQGIAQHLYQEGLLSVAAPPAPAPAMIFQALRGGLHGNNIHLVVSDVKLGKDAARLSPMETTFSLKAYQKDVNVDLRLSNIRQRLGTTDKPEGMGLVHVDPGTDDDSKDHAPVPAEIDMGSALELGPSERDRVKAVKDENGKKLFSVGVRDPERLENSNSPYVKVMISDVDKEAESFTLTAVWEAKKIKDITIAPQTFEDKVRALQYAVRALPTEGRNTYRVPKAGEHALGGGTETAPAQVQWPAHEPYDS